VSITRLKAPFTRESESISRSSSVASRERASRCTITSLSEVVLKIAPRPSSSRRTARAFTRLPLCAIATGPPSVFAQNGCALRSRLPPVVE
jgi:hypothetical protein